MEATVYPKPIKDYLRSEVKKLKDNASAEDIAKDSKINYDAEAKNMAPDIKDVELKKLVLQKHNLSMRFGIFGLGDTAIISNGEKKAAQEELNVLRELFQTLDVNNDRQITYVENEILKACLNSSKNFDEALQKAKTVRQVIDFDNNGKISDNEIVALKREWACSNSIDDFIKTVENEKKEMLAELKASEKNPVMLPGTVLKALYKLGFFYKRGEQGVLYENVGWDAALDNFKQRYKLSHINDDICHKDILLTLDYLLKDKKKDSRDGVIPIELINPKKSKTDDIRVAAKPGHGKNKNGMKDRMLLTQSKSFDKYLPEIKKYSAGYNVPLHMILAVIRIESAWNPRAKSKTNAMGFMQLMKPAVVQTKIELKKDLYSKNYGNSTYLPQLTIEAIDKLDPLQINLRDEEQHNVNLINIRVGVRYLKYLLDKYKNYQNASSELAIVAYNLGEGILGNILKQNFLTPNNTNSVNLLIALRKSLNPVNRTKIEEAIGYIINFNLFNAKYADWCQKNKNYLANIG
ncbi:MAG: transglycosylase SLT domain-containing protein [Candidatus Margulisbacteria bacterium]|nr:transglycosylase SLT domain-containing protein [Candidatus Margulisiibacteriota bacterium]